MVKVKIPNGGKLVVIVLAAFCEAAWAGAVDENRDYKPMEGEWEG